MGVWPAKHPCNSGVVDMPEKLCGFQFFLLRLPESLAVLVAPYCAIPRDYLSGTPLLRAMGILVSPFLSISLFESI